MCEGDHVWSQRNNNSHIHLGFWYNLFDSYTLLRGIQLAKQIRCRSLIVLGYSLIAIKDMIGDSIQLNYKLYFILDKVREEAKTLNKVSFFHVKRDFNQEANYWVKRASSLTLGGYIQNGEGSIHIIP